MNSNAIETQKKLKQSLVEITPVINSFASEIKDRVNIVDHITRFEDLTQQGNDWRGPHSTHSREGSDSNCFSIKSDESYFKCFACDASGDVISYEAQRLEIPNVEAMKSLAQEYNIPIPDLSSHTQLSPEEKAFLEEKSDQVRRITQIQNDFQIFVSKRLDGRYLQYLLDRGLTEKSIEEFKLGYCPRTMDEFVGDYRKEDLISSGLFAENSAKKLYPILYRRIIVSHLQNGKPVYFTGRSIDKDLDPTYKAQRSTADDINEFAVERVSIQCGSFHDKLADKRTYKKILITEGTFDCLLAAQEFGNEYVVLSNNTTSLSKVQLENLGSQFVRMTRREIIFCHDNDSNNSGQSGAFESAKKLENCVKEKLIQNYGSENGMPVEEINKLLNSPVIPLEISENLPRIKISIIRRPPELDSIDVADFITNQRSAELKRWIESTLTVRDYENYLISNPNRFAAGVRGGFRPDMLVNEIEREGRFYISLQNKSLQNKLYTYFEGVYRPDNGDLEKLIEEKTNRTATDAQITEVVKKLNRLNSYDVVEALPELNSTKVNLLNGWLDLDVDPSDKDQSSAFYPHSPYLISIIQLNVSYDPDANCPLVESFLDSILETHDVFEILKWMAYSLEPGQQYQKALMCPGFGANGKGTLFSLWQDFLGEGNYSTRSLHDIEEKQFAAADLYGSLVNFGSEIPNRAIVKGSGVFKEITGGDVITVEEKYGQPFKFKPLCKLIFSANELPFITDRTYGQARRWIYIPFDRKIEDSEQDLKLAKKITTDEEKSGLLNVLRYAYKMLKIDSGFIQSDRGNEVKEEHMEDNDRFSVFVRNFIEFDTNKKVLSIDLYAVFQNFEMVYHKGSIRHSQTRLNKELKRLTTDKGVIKKIDSENLNRMTWFGISLDPDAVELLQEEYTTQYGSELGNAIESEVNL